MIRRGEIWWAALGIPVGSEPGFRRPALVIQSDEYNASELRTIIAVALTSNTRLADMPGNVLLSPAVTGLPKPSVANVTQIFTCDKRQLARKVGVLPPRIFRLVEQGVRSVLELE